MSETAQPNATAPAPVQTTAAELLDQSPEQVPAAESVTAGPTEPTPPPSPEPETGTDPKPGEKDSLGREFNPEKFRPKKDSQGRWVNLRGGKPRADGTPAQPRTGNPSPKSEPTGTASRVSHIPDTPAGPDRFDLAAELYCRTFYGIADNAFSGGGEWQPDNAEEHLVMRNAVAGYLRSKDMEELPPGWLLVFVVGGYSAKRLQRPKTNEKWKYLVAYWKERLWKFLDRLFKKKPQPTVS